MKLQFLARPGNVCHWPAAVRATGQIYNYVGRTFDPVTRVHKANAEPIEIDDEHGDAAQVVRAERLKELTKRDSALWPANEETAKRCGVAFVPVELRDGEWQPIPEVIAPVLREAPATGVALEGITVPADGVERTHVLESTGADLPPIHDTESEGKA